LHDRRRTLETQRMLGDGDLEFRAQGRAPAVLGMHGFGGTASELRPMVDRIAEAGYAVEAPLMPGHGARAHELQEHTLDTWAEAMRARATSLVERHERVVLIGFSLGSLVAMHLAAERPPWLAALVVLGNALTLRAHSRWPLGAWDRLGWKMPDVYLRKPRPADMTDRDAAEHLTTYDRHPLRAALEVYRAGKRVRESVSRIACPTLVLHGKRDLVCSVKNASWLASNLGTRDVSVRIFEKSAHVLAADIEREDVAREVVRFLARIG
jgi:carboxylesterase